MLGTLVDYSYEQGLIPEKRKSEDLFAASSIDL